MKLLIFGATGGVGIELVKQALQKNHEVTAFVRNSEKLHVLKSSNLHFQQGNIMNSKQVNHAIQNQDAVICVIGDGKVGKVRSIGTKHIIEGMNKAAIKRLVCQTTLGLGESYGNLNYIWKHIMFGFLLKKAFQDHKRQEQIITNSDLDYIIVRPSALTDGDITQNYKVDFDGSVKNLKLKISRADVADFILSQLDENFNIGKTISISN